MLENTDPPNIRQKYCIHLTKIPHNNDIKENWVGSSGYCNKLAAEINEFTCQLFPTLACNRYVILKELETLAIEKIEL